MQHTYITVPSPPAEGIPGVGVATGGVVVPGMVGCVVVGTTGMVAVLERIVP